MQTRINNTYLKYSLAMLLSTSAMQVESNSFNVSGSNILDPDGNVFVPKGVNVFTDNSEDYASIVDCWQFNTVRVNHYVDWAWYGVEWELDLIESTFADNNVVTILDLAHDAADQDSGIGKYWLPRKQEVIDLYIRYAEKYKDNPYVWFELINEPGTLDFDSEAWVDIHQALITAIRSTGNNNPILVSGWCWGQDACNWSGSEITSNESAILGLGDQVLTIDGVSQSNIIFTHHVYDQFQYASASRLSDFHDRVLDKNYALIVGEYGSENTYSTMQATSYMFESTQQHGIGRIAWNWDGTDPSDLTDTSLGNDFTANTHGSGSGSGSGIDSCENPSNLTELGALIWNDNHAE